MAFGDFADCVEYRFLDTEAAKSFQVPEIAMSGELASVPHDFLEPGDFRRAQVRLPDPTAPVGGAVWPETGAEEDSQ